MVIRYLEKKNTFRNIVPITKITQTGPEKEVLKTEFFAEILGLSVDVPTTKENFPLKKAYAILHQHPLIRSALIKFHGNDTLYIDYETKKPYAYVGNFDNLAMDREGSIFPVKPFIKQFRLPSILFPEEEMVKLTTWQSKIDSLSFHVAMDIIEFFFNECLTSRFWISQIDVSRIGLNNCGKKEIILSIENEMTGMHFPKGAVISPHIVRLPTKDYIAACTNYLSLRENLLKKEANISLNFGEAHVENIQLPTKIIDLRIPNLGFVK